MALSAVQCTAFGGEKVHLTGGTLRCGTRRRRREKKLGNVGGQRLGSECFRNAVCRFSTGGIYRLISGALNYLLQLQLCGLRRNVGREGAEEYFYCV